MQPAVLFDLQGKGPGAAKKPLCCLEFLLLCFQEKSKSPAAIEQTALYIKLIHNRKPKSFRQL